MSTIGCLKFFSFLKVLTVENKRFCKVSISVTHVCIASEHINKHQTEYYWKAICFPNT